MKEYRIWMASSMLMGRRFSGNRITNRTKDAHQPGRSTCHRKHPPRLRLLPLAHPPTPLMPERWHPSP